MAIVKAFGWFWLRVIFVHSIFPLVMISTIIAATIILLVIIDCKNKGLIAPEG